MHGNSSTRYSQNSSYLMEYVCSNIHTASCSLVEAGLSDHQAIVCNFNYGTNIKNKSNHYGRLYFTKKFNLFKQLCENLQRILEHGDPLSVFHDSLLDIFNQAFPVRLLKEKKKKRWITRGLKVSARNLRLLHYIRKFVRSNSFSYSYFHTYRKL